MPRWVLRLFRTRNRTNLVERGRRKKNYESIDPVQKSHACWPRFPASLVCDTVRPECFRGCATAGWWLSEFYHGGRSKRAKKPYSWRRKHSSRLVFAFQRHHSQLQYRRWCWDARIKHRRQQYSYGHGSTSVE